MKPGIYKHFKGPEYMVYGTAMNTETGEETVIYRPMYGRRALCSRNLAMFNEHVERDGYAGPRFSFVREASTAGRDVFIEKTRGEAENGALIAAILVDDAFEVDALLKGNRAQQTQIARLLKELDGADFFESPRQKAEFKRERVVEIVTEAVEGMVLDASDGSNEETELLTARVARKLIVRALLPFDRNMQKADLEKSNERAD